MEITARINNNEIIKLAKWDVNTFSIDQCLYIMSDDSKHIKGLFENLAMIEIFVSGNPVATYTHFNGFAEISLMGTQYIEYTNGFSDVMKVRLTKTDIVDQVKRLEAQINPVVNVEEMNLEELRAYTLSAIAEEGQKTIFAGTNVQLSDGTYPLFTMKLEDQSNLATAMMMIDKLIGIETDVEIMIPYHSSKSACTHYSLIDMFKIYSTLQLYSTKIQTYTNLLNAYIRRIGDIDELKAVTFGMELPEDLQKQFDELYNTSMLIMTEMTKKYIPETKDTTEAE